MSLIHRISRLFRADVHGFIDYLEEPDVMLRQALRDMEEAILERERGCNVLREELRKARHIKEELQEKLDSIQEKITLCFAEADENLAKKFIRRKLETRKHLELSQNAVREKSELLEGVVQQLEEDKAKYEEILEKTRILSDVEVSEDCASDMEVSNDEVEVEFLKEKRERLKTDVGHVVAE